MCTCISHAHMQLASYTSYTENRTMQGGSWHYNVYNPSTFQYQELQGQNPYIYNTASSRRVSPTASEPEPPSPSSHDQGSPKYCVILKVLDPQNKRNYTMFTLRVTEEDLTSLESIKQAIFVQVGENVVSRKLNFQLGYIKRSRKIWINNERDIQDALEILKAEKLTLWCIGLGEHARKRAREHDESDDGAGASDTEASTSCSKKKKTATEERESRVVELKKKLREKHGSAYSGIQFSVWAETIAAGNHESLDNPPTGILNFGSRPRGRSSHFEAVGKIASALSPTTTCTTSTTSAYRGDGEPA